MADLRLSDIAEATRLLTRLPLPHSSASPRGGNAAWAYPVAGFLVSSIAALVVAISQFANLSAPIAAALAIVASILVTGALHEDGLADTADGLWGGQSRDRRLEIMKDSRIGAFGVLALILTVLLRWTAITDLVTTGHATGTLIAAGALSRAFMPPAMSLLPFARQDGLAVSVGTVPTGTCALAMTIGGGLALVFGGSTAIAAMLVSALAVFVVIKTARAKIGGITGDILGATQQVCEIAALCCFAAFT